MSTWKRGIAMAAALAVSACAGPKAVETRQKLETLDLGGALSSYLEWRRQYGTDDPGALKALALQTLYQAMRSSSPEARRLAIEAAWDLDQAELAEAVTRLLDDDDDVVRATAAAALIKAHPDAGMVLGESLRSPEPEARVVAVRAVGERVGKKAAADLRKALEDGDGRVRMAAVQAVASLRDPADVATFVKLAAGDAYGPVRAAALRALGRAKAPEGVAAARAALADSYLGARLAGIDVLAALARAEAAPELQRIAAGDEPFAALHAGAQLARLGQREPGLAAYRRASTDAEWTVRAAAANALPAIAAKAEAPGLLAPLSADPNVEVRLAAARALIQVGKRGEAIALLVAEAQGGGEPALRLEAAIDLLRLADASGQGTLHTLLDSDAPAAVRARAASALRSGGELSQQLIAAMGDADWHVRVQAAWSVLALMSK